MFQSYFLKEKNPKDQNTQVTATPNILPDFTNDIPERTQALALSQSICILIQPLHMHVYSPAPLMPWVQQILTLPAVPQVALFASFAPLLVMLRPNASSSSVSFAVLTPLHHLQLPLPPHRLSHLQTPHSPPQLHQQVPFHLPHSSMTLTPPGMQTLAPQLI